MQSTKLSNKFNIVFMNKEFYEYIEKSINDKENIKKHYNNIILEYINKNILDDEEYAGLGEQYIGTTMYNLDKLKEEINILTNEKADKIVENALEESYKYLFDESYIPTFCIVPADPDNTFIRDNMKGVAGITLGNGVTIININPTVPEWKNTLKHGVPHEYHHNVLLTGEVKTNKDFNLNLLKYLLIEGKADSLANIVYPDIDEMPWLEKLPNEIEIWEKIKPNLDSYDNDYISKVVFGDNIEYPQWAGYKIGYSIVQTFIKNNPDMSVMDWTYLDDKEFIKLSGYK